MIKCILIFVLCLVYLAPCNSSQIGIAFLSPTKSFGMPLDIEGSVKFIQDTSSPIVFVSAKITGLTPLRSYAIHVHNFGDLTDNSTGLTSGEHYAGSGSKNHGCPPSADRHEGDMGNWTANANGYIDSTKSFDLLQLTGGFSIIGRAVVLHEKFDNCSGPSGYAGNRLGVGVIGINNSKENVASNGDSPTSSPMGVAVLFPTSDAGGICESPCGGVVYFKQIFNQSSGEDVAAGIEVTANVSGLKLGSVHGFHIHEYGDLTVSNGSSAGAHWNPDGYLHNLPPYMPRHKGDLGNIQSYDSVGNRNAWYYDEYRYINELNGIFGRMVVIHEKNDHGNGSGCDQAGGAGKRVLWGVVGIADPSTVAPKVPSTVTINNNYVIEPCNNEGSDSTDGVGEWIFLAVFGGVGWGCAIGLFLILIFICVRSIRKQNRKRERMEDELRMRMLLV